MANLLSLPTEIQRQCFNFLDGAALKSIRSTSKALNDVATETLFDLATLRVTEDSVQRFSNIINNAGLRRCVRTLYLDSELDKYVMYDCCSSREVSQWWKDAIAGWSSIILPNLRRITLDIGWSCVQDGNCTSLALAVKTFVLQANIEALTVKHLQDVCDDKNLDAAQISIVPKQLNLLIDTWKDEACPDHDVDNRQRHAFFNDTLNISWLSPKQTQLTHLTLHCNTYWGTYPRWQPGELHFPALKSIALSKWTISFDWQFDFIISHGQTLEQLVLTDCPILYATRMMRHQHNNAWQMGRPSTSRGPPPTTKSFFDTRWHHVLPMFQDQLSNLKHFSMGRGPVAPAYWGEADLSADEAFDNRYALAPCIDSSRYAIFDFGEGTIQYERPKFEYYTKNVDDEVESWRMLLEKERWNWLEREIDEDVKRKVAYPECLREDQEALEQLLSVVRERARLSGGC